MNGGPGHRNEPTWKVIVAPAVGLAGMTFEQRGVLVARLAAVRGVQHYRSANVSAEQRLRVLRDLIEAHLTYRLEDEARQLASALRG